MRFEMKMPDLSTNDSDVRIVRWLIEPGQAIERGRPCWKSRPTRPRWRSNRPSVACCKRCDRRRTTR